MLIVSFSAAIAAAAHNGSETVATEVEAATETGMTVTATVRKKLTVEEEEDTTPTGDHTDKMKTTVTTTITVEDIHNKANGPIITNNNMTDRMAITSHLLR